MQQIRRKATPEAHFLTKHFHASRNRVEFISDFSPDNDAEIISSLKVHPQGWVAVTRNVTADEMTEVSFFSKIHAN